MNYYRLKQTDLDGGERISEIKAVSMNIKDANSIKMFPNPVVNTLQIEGIEPGAQLRVVDAKGTVVNQFTAQASYNSLSVEKFHPGVYFVQVITANTTVKSLRFVKM